MHYDMIGELCRSGGLVPSVVGSDQGWFFIRRIVVGQLVCSVYEVRDGCEPRRGFVRGDTGEYFYTKARVHKPEGRARRKKK